MELSELRADNFRLFASLSLQPHRRLNFIVGPNAAGKTSLLEMIYLLGRGRSFRGGSQAELAGGGGRDWTVFGRRAEAGAARGSLGVRWAANEREIRIDGAAASTLELLRRLPVQILEPGMHRVLQEGPTYRRSFVDWGVFHVEPSFLPTWKRYQRALRQRNQLLRAGGSGRELAAWEPELAEAGSLLHAQREQHLAGVAERLSQPLARLLGEGAWSLDLHPGWPRGQELAAALARSRDSDRRSGLTSAGPHRAELRIRAGGSAARHRISRGQQKLLIAALLLAQCECIAASSGQAPLLLVDDLGAELAPHYQAALLEVLQGYAGQVFITSFDAGGVLSQASDAALFHVERGRLRTR